MNKFILKHTDALLLVVDIQERLHNVMDPNFKSTYVKNSAILIETAKAFGMPILVSEQYPRGLGKTIPEIDALLKSIPKIEKLFFSCWREAPIKAAIETSDRKTVIVIGIEAHVCVMQTVMDLLQAGYNAVVATDAVCSRFGSDRFTAIGAMIAAGAVVYSTESIVFLLLEKAGTPTFKQLMPLFKP